MFDHSDSSDCEGHPLPHRRPQQLHEPHHLRGRKRKWKFYKKKLDFIEISKKVYHFSERSRLTRYSSTNTTRIHFSSRQKTQRLQNCKFAKDANLQTMQIFPKNANLQKSPKSQKWQQNTIIIERGQMQRFSIVSSSRRHQTLSHSGSNRETGSVNLKKSPSPPDAHLLTPPPVSPIVTATNLWISQSLLRVNRFLVVSLDLTQTHLC